MMAVDDVVVAVDDVGLQTDSQPQLTIMQMLVS
jgi:hypothetical protein